MARDVTVSGERPLVYILIVNWNRWEDTLRCVDAVLRSTYEPFRVVVIDNGSDARAPAELPEEVELVENGGNLGYAGGNNAGIRIALEHEAAYVWILNNDATVEPDALAELVAVGQSDRAWGALTSQIRLPDGSEDVGLVGRLPAGERWDPVRRPEPVSPSSASPEAVESVGLLRGPSILLRTEALARVGLFDESYFHYLEEMDLMERLVRDGWRLGLVRRSIVIHAKGSTLPYATPQSLYYLHRNHFHFERKLFGRHPVRVVLDHPFLRLRNMLALRHTLRGDLRPLVAQARALNDAIHGRTGPVDLGADYLEPMSDGHRLQGSQRLP